MNIVREYINEKFEEESDPIKDLGIGIEGLKKFWIKSIDKEGHISSIQSSLNYFGTDKYADEAYIIYKTIVNIVEKDANSEKEIQSIFVDTFNIERKRIYRKLRIDKIIDILNNVFSVPVVITDELND